MDGEVAATGVMQEASAAGLGSSLARGTTEAAAVAGEGLGAAGTMDPGGGRGDGTRRLGARCSRAEATGPPELVSRWCCGGRARGRQGRGRGAREEKQGAASGDGAALDAGGGRARPRRSSLSLCDGATREEGIGREARVQEGEIEGKRDDGARERALRCGLGLEQRGGWA